MHAHEMQNRAYFEADDRDRESQRRTDPPERDLAPGNPIRSRHNGRSLTTWHR